MNAELTRFDRACSGLIDSGFVTATGHITDILKTIAGAPAILELIRSCMENVDFIADFERSKAPDGLRGFRLLPPDGYRDFVAYAFGVLFHIDRGDLDFTNLLTTYFADENIHGSFRRFASEIVDRFRRAVEILAESGEEPVSQEEVFQEERKSDATALALLSRYTEKIGSSDLPIDRKEELLVMADGVKRALATGDEALIYATAVGFKKVYADCAEFCGCAEELPRELKRSGLI